MGEKSDTPENVTDSFHTKHFNRTMNRLGERRLAQGLKPNLKHLYHEAQDAVEMDIDPTTGLLNRRAYEQRELEIIKLAKRAGIELVFMRFDVNELKPINDTLGHKAGDQKLKDAAEAILESLRETDLVGRVGGDEFKVVLVGASLNEAENIWNTRLLQGFQQRGVKISAGASVVDKSTEESIVESDDLADDAQSIAKIASRTSGVSEFRTTNDLTAENIMDRSNLRKEAERGTN